MSTLLAIPVWEDQVSSTLDFAGSLLVVEAERGKELARKLVKLRNEAVESRAKRIADLAVDVVICGAVSKRLGEAVLRQGIQLIPYVSGPVDNVLAASLCGLLAKPCFLQPGCHPGARRRWRHGAGRGAHDNVTRCRELMKCREESS